GAEHGLHEGPGQEDEQAQAEVQVRRRSVRLDLPMPARPPCLRLLRITLRPAAEACARQAHPQGPGDRAHRHRGRHACGEEIQGRRIGCERIDWRTRGRFMARGAVSRLTRIGVLVAVFIAIAATPAAASVTLGQLSPGGPGGTCAIADFAQLSVASGNSYTVPGTGTITQWRHNANSGVGQSLTLKDLRKAADPNVWQGIGLD